MLLGGKLNESVGFMGFVQGDTTEEIATHAKQLAKEGYEVIYLKVDVLIKRHCKCKSS